MVFFYIYIYISSYFSGDKLGQVISQVCPNYYPLPRQFCAVNILHNINNEGSYSFYLYFKNSILFYGYKTLFLCQVEIEGVAFIETIHCTWIETVEVCYRRKTLQIYLFLDKRAYHSIWLKTFMLRNNIILVIHLNALMLSLFLYTHGRGKQSGWHKHREKDSTNKTSSGF